MNRKPFRGRERKIVNASWILSVGLLVASLYGIKLSVLALARTRYTNDVTVATPLAKPVIAPFVTPTLVASPVPAPTDTSAPVTIAAKVNHDVPFTVQAPTGNWDDVHEELCEEAAALMAQWYAHGKAGVKQGNYANQIPPVTAEEQFAELVTWQDKVYGYYKDTNAEQVARMLKEKMGVPNVTLLKEVTSESLKRELNKGNVVLAPTAGRILKNPYYSGEGPPYHMIVIRGYNENGFIANDSGTRRGEGYVYKESILLDAIHDWTGSKDTITTGAKVVISVGR